MLNLYHLIFLCVLHMNITLHGSEWVLVCLGVKLQESSDDTRESWYWVRRKKEYPEDKRKAQETLAPTQAVHTGNTIKSLSRLEMCCSRSLQFLPFRCFHVTGTGNMMSPISEQNSHFTKHYTTCKRDDFSIQTLGGNHVCIMKSQSNLEGELRECFPFFEGSLYRCYQHSSAQL